MNLNWDTYDFIAVHCIIQIICGFVQNIIKNSLLLFSCFLFYLFHDCLHVCLIRELVEELHPLMKEALERRPEVRCRSLETKDQNSNMFCWVHIALAVLMCTVVFALENLNRLCFSVASFVEQEAQREERSAPAAAAAHL